MYSSFRVVSICIGAFAIFVSASYQEDPDGKAGATGSPGENTCAESGCHTGTSVNGGPGNISIIAPELDGGFYTPGQTYTIQVKVEESGRDLFGLGFEALKSNGDNAGTLVAGNDNQIKNKNVGGFQRKNIVHDDNTGASADSHTFTFSWTAPSTDVGTVTFYTAGNAANGDNEDSGDHIYTTFFEMNAFVGINENVANEPEMSVYPNPVSNVLNIAGILDRSSNVQMRITDMQCKEVKILCNEMMYKGEFKRQFDVAELSSGNYMLEVWKNNSLSTTKPIIIQ
jgi:hypothetical protein